MTYQDACSFREMVLQYKPELGLERMRLLMNELNNVQNECKVIHVAGTNGKGSVCSMLSEVLCTAGYRIGRYHSPVVFEEREVFLLDGNCISEEEYASTMEEVKCAWERVVDKTGKHPTSFEVDTALAFLWFYNQKCDFVILETGLGGRDDATNVGANTLVSVFTSISRDHMEFLGDTIEKIASIKAGIIKPKSHIVTGIQKEKVLKILKEYGDFYGESFRVASEVTDVQLKTSVRAKDLQGYLFSYKGTKNLFLPSLATYQLENAALVLEVLEELTFFGVQVTKTHIQEGFAKLSWEGRMEKLSNQPEVYIDGAHNEDAARKLSETISKFSKPYSWIMIFGVMKDKEYDKIMKWLLPFAKVVYTVTPKNERAMNAEELSEIIKMNYSTQVYPVSQIKEAVDRAYVHAMVENKHSKGTPVRVLAFGSLYYLKEVKRAVYEVQQRHS